MLKVLKGEGEEEGSLYKNLLTGLLGHFCLESTFVENSNFIICGILKWLDGQTWQNVPITKKKWEHLAEFDWFFIVRVQ